MDGFTVATTVLADVHIPPLTVDENVVVDPTQIFCVPLKVPVVGGAVTVMVRV